MKVGIIGAGSIAVIPQSREILRTPGILQGAELVLMDIDLPRVETVAHIVRQMPEAKALGATVRATGDLDEAIEGADFVQIIARPWSVAFQSAAVRVTVEHGHLGSDNLSLTGAFLALRSGPFALDVARRMERLAPKATLIVFTNPVPILVMAVSRATSIRTIGICGGQANHCWDLSRMMNWDRYCFDFEAEAAGINHFSWILACRLHGKDFLPEFDRKLREEGIDYDALKSDPIYEHLLVVLPRMEYAYKEYGALLFSSEPDGLPHLAWYDEEVARQRSGYEGSSAPAPRARGANRERKRANFLKRRAQTFGPEFWSAPDGPRWREMPHRKVATNALLIEGLRGDRPVDVTCTTLNRGAVEGFPDDVAMEYTVRLEKDTLRPKDRYRLPRIARGLSHMLVEHQSYVADAVVQESKKLFLHGLAAYPMARDRRVLDAYVAATLEVGRDELPKFVF